MKPLLMATLTALVFATSLQPCGAQGGKAKAVKTIVKMLTGIGAAEAARRSGQSFEEYQQHDAILTSLRSQGVDANNSSVFSVYFKVENGGGYWADFWSKPDVFFIVDIEGHGSHLVPQIHNNYQGHAILDKIVAQTIQPGSRVVVRVLDDDSTSDLMWNNILKTRVRLSVTPSIQATQFVSIGASAGGEVVLLDRNTTIDAPDFIAAAEFRVPESDDGLWVADATLVDDSGKSVGALQFAALWSAPERLAEQEEKTKSSYGKFLFWGVIAICLLGWFAKQDTNDDSTPTEETP